MTRKILIILIVIVLSSCNDSRFGIIESSYDNLNYESLTNSIGTVYVKLDTMVKKYEKAKIIYSESDTSTMLIQTKENKYVYIQGPAIIELDTINIGN